MQVEQEVLSKRLRATGTVVLQLAPQRGQEELVPSPGAPPFGQLKDWLPFISSSHLRGLSAVPSETIVSLGPFRAWGGGPGPAPGMMALYVVEWPTEREYRPIESITSRAAEFIRQESLSSAVEQILSVLVASFRELERVSIDLESDPEAEDNRWLSGTLRLRGEPEKILEAEQSARRTLREKLAPQDYQEFTLSYELVG